MSKGSTRRYRERARATARAVPLPDGLDPDSIGAAAALYVAQYRRQHHQGPTWAELAGHLHPQCRTLCCGPDQLSAVRAHVPPAHQARLVRQLVKSGWLTATKKPRSLDVGDGS